LVGSAPRTIVAGASLQLSASAAQLVVPVDMQHGAYAVTVNGGAAIICGEPEIWWAQGEGGNFSVAGGWLRVFGRNMALPDANDSTEERRRSIRAEHLAERSKRAAQLGDWQSVAALATELAALAGVKPVSVGATTAKLCLRGSCTTLTADSSTSQWQARFWLPASMQPGEYSLSVSNGHVTGNMSTFIGTSTELKDLRTTTVKATTDPHVVWPTKIFCVESFGCDGGFFTGRFNASGNVPVGLDCTDNGFPYNCPRNCSAAVQAAIDAAGSAGGGVVSIGVGRWYLDGPLLLPHNVRLKGAGMDRTAIYFAFRNATNTPSTMIGPIHGKRATSSAKILYRCGRVSILTEWAGCRYQTGRSNVSSREIRSRRPCSVPAAKIVLLPL
jgi:hypothetical protein